MNETTPKICDNKSVGVILRNNDGSVALIKRAFFPIGYAPVAGHIDDHGSVEQAAVDEVREEVGLTIAKEDLQPTSISERRYTNHCRRQGGTYHDWSVFIVNTYSGEIVADAEETKGADWYSIVEVQQLADRTREYQAQMIEQAAWEAEPGLEEIWVDMLSELAFIR